MNKKKNKIIEKEKSNNNVIDPNRRDFINKTWKVLGVIAGLQFTGLTIHYLVEQKKSNENSNLFEAGIPSEFPNNSVTPFRRGHFYLIRMLDGGFIAVSLKCSHLGCSIMWNEDEMEFICPCHSSKFNIAGDVINPPAPRALDIYEIQLINGKIFINLNKKIKRDDFEKSQLIYV